MKKLLGLPLVGSAHGVEVDNFIWYVHLLMIALFVGWTAYFFYTIWRFRQSRNPKADYVGTTTHASSWIEGAVAIVEGVLLIGFAIPLWAHAVDKFPPADKSTVIRVIAKQFEWLARYPGPDGKFGSNRIDLISNENPMGLDKSDPAAKDDIIAGAGEMAVPVGKPVIAHISSLDVIHSFKVVPLRMTQDANPGMSIPVHFVPTITNSYQIQCSQLCGSGHAKMRGFFKVLTPEEFDAWLKKKAGGAASYE
jgi:cytochrome c oxidase subunit 2